MRIASCLRLHCQQRKDALESSDAATAEQNREEPAPQHIRHNSSFNTMSNLRLAPLPLRHHPLNQFGADPRNLGALTDAPYAALLPLVL